MKPTIVALFVAVFVLSACNTVKGIGQDVENAGQAIKNAGNK